MPRIQLSIYAFFMLACAGIGGSDEAEQVTPPPPTATDVPSQPPPGVALPPVDVAPEAPDPCLDPVPTPAPQGCVMDTLSCGETLSGNNQFGTANFDDDFYQGKYCTPQRNRYVESSEAVYMLEVPADIKAVVTLTSECEDLDLVALSWNEPQRCPTIKHNISECEMDTHPGGGSVTLTTVTRAQKYLVIVDGKKGVTGNFELAVDCSEYR